MQTLVQGKAIILAAGKGERLVQGFAFPKPLKRIVGVPLIVRILRSLERAQVREVGIVLGFLGNEVEASISRYNFDLDIHFFWNEEIEKPNGTSLLKAADFVESSAYVLMADHLWSSRLFDAVRRTELGEKEAVLGVDYRISRCFDLEDATKVRVEGGRVVEIGKTLSRYNGLDTGVFRITRSFLEALESVNGPSGCSLSEGVTAFTRMGCMRAADTGDALWIDVDTPEAHAFAERLVSRYGDELDTAVAGPETVASSLR